MNSIPTWSHSTSPTDCWPTPTQELLLRAALGQGEDAVNSWLQWREGTDVEHLDGGSARLLPLLWRNLKTQGVEGTQLIRYKSVARHHWVQNQILLKRAARLIEQLERENIPTLVLKGAALVSLYYPDISTRPMDDFDVLVPTRDAPRTFEFLRAQGYGLDRRMNEWNYSPRSLDRSLDVIHSISCKKPGEDSFDLHRHVFWEEYAIDADDEFWESAIPLCIGGVPTRALCPEDAFLHVCAHGAAWNEVPPLRWVADAVLILRATPDFDWHRLTTQTRRRGMALPMLAAMRYLNRLNVQPIPPSVVRELAQIPTSRAARRQWWAVSHSRHSHSLALKFWIRARAFNRWNATNPVIRRPFSLPLYLQLFWGLDSSWQVVLYGLTRLRHILQTKRSHL